MRTCSDSFCLRMVNCAVVGQTSLEPCVVHWSAEPESATSLNRCSMFCEATVSVPDAASGTGFTVAGALPVSVKVTGYSS